MNKFAVLYGVATATLFACCLCTVSAGTLKAAAAEAINDSKPASDSKFEARLGGGGLGLGLGGGGGGGGGWGGWNPALHGHENYTGPSVIALALPIAVALVIALWIAAYNTLRSPPPKIGYNAGIVESAGWGGQHASSYIAGGYGWEPAGSEHQSAVASNLATSAVVQAAASSGTAAAAATGRAIDELTHRVARSIER